MNYIATLLNTGRIAAASLLVFGLASEGAAAGDRRTRATSSAQIAEQFFSTRLPSISVSTENQSDQSAH
jgi:hypothetical protein